MVDEHYRCGNDLPVPCYPERGSFQKEQEKGITQAALNISSVRLFCEGELL